MYRLKRVISVAAVVIWTLALMPAGGPPAEAEPQGIFKLEHLIFIVQENRSFDHYFGTYPGARGIPTKPNGSFKPCLPHPVLKKCSRPFRTNNPVNLGGPHSHWAAVQSIAGGKMNGFVEVAGRHGHSAYCVQNPTARRCRKFNGPQHQPDLMSVMGRDDIPNYWTYADNFVLQDMFFEGVDSWSLPAHMYLMSAWSASCRKVSNPMSCRSDPEPEPKGTYAWTDITYLLEEAGVTWGYFVGDGTNLSCGSPPCAPDKKATSTPASWNPVPQFRTVQQNHNFGNVMHHQDFFDMVQGGSLPQVSWVIPGIHNSEHPGNGTMATGPPHVTRVINAIMGSGYWDTSAIFVSWDDWGGFYDHMKPVVVDNMGFGIRVPAFVVGPYAKQGFVDHQPLSSDAYLKLIEDRFLGGSRLDPDTMSRPDSRPSVRENEPKLGDLTADFDFTQPPRPPLILDPQAG